MYSDARRRSGVTDFMTKKNLLLMLAALGLATVYVVWFSGWFQPKAVRIFHTNRNLRGNMKVGSSLTFGVNHATRFTELKVVPLNAYETNKDVVPVWHLISDSNSAPVKIFYYGQNIPGMRPALNGVRAEQLETNVPYRMFVTAGKVKGQHDFELH
jgi:hypothetical protein